jgi:RimJ/RimL family protein N-acetyltransferase
MDARHYSAHETLRDGLEVQIRSLRPDDADRVAEAFAKLEQETIYLRFFGYKRELTDADWELIRELDFDTRVMLVVTLVEKGREIIIGSGSYARVGPDAAEVAFLVEEDYHGRGIARRVLRHLGEIARARGIVRFEAEVLPHNKAMLRVFAASGWPVTSRHDEGVVHVTLQIA